MDYFCTAVLTRPVDDRVQEADGDDLVERGLGEAVALVVRLVGHGLDIDDEEVLRGHSVRSVIEYPVATSITARRPRSSPEYADIRKAGHGGGDFMFVPVSIASPAKEEVAENLREIVAPSRGFDQIEWLFWESIKNSTDPADFRAYLEQYPIGSFVPLARNRLKKLE